MSGATNGLIERLRATGPIHPPSDRVSLDLRWPHDDAQELALRRAVVEAEREAARALRAGARRTRRRR